MMKTRSLTGIGLFSAIVVLVSCSGNDINNDQAVLKDMQGTWVGYDQTGDLYTHIKVYISENTFNGWIQMSDSGEEPFWSVLPNEKGTYSLSSVQENTDGPGKYRKLSFAILGRCCGDNSLTAKTLTKMIAYEDSRGLSIVGRGVSMVRR